MYKYCGEMIHHYDIISTTRLPLQVTFSQLFLIPVRSYFPLWCYGKQSECLWLALARLGWESHVVLPWLVQWRLGGFLGKPPPLVLKQLVRSFIYRKWIDINVENHWNYLTRHQFYSSSRLSSKNTNIQKRKIGYFTLCGTVSQSKQFEDVTLGSGNL